MNRYCIIRAAPLFEDIAKVERRFSLPTGFPIPIDQSTMEIHEPGLLFLAATLLDRAYPDGFPSSAPSVAQDLRDLLEYLDVNDLDWRHLRDEVIEQYRDDLLTLISPITHDAYSLRTIKRRLSVALSFRKYLHAQGWSEVSPASTEAVGRYVATDSLQLIHAASTAVESRRLRVMPRNRARSIDRIRPLTPARVRVIFEHLGPRPPLEGGAAAGTTPTRDRLLAELALCTGLRRMEVRSLTRWQIEELVTTVRREKLESDDIVSLELKRTKGQRAGKVFVPVWLIDSLEWYIRFERQEAFASSNIRAEPTALFLNHRRTLATDNAGLPITDDTISRTFRAACIKAGFAKRPVRAHPLGGTPKTFTEAQHTFHDLRHTFAVWLYLAEESAGNSAPWKTVQTRLRHAQLSTTVATYLSGLEDYKAEIGQNMRNFHQEVRERVGI